MGRPLSKLSNSPAGRLGARIRQARLSARMSQSDLAQAAGASQRAISGIERGEMVPGGFCLVKLLVALDLTIDDILPEG